VDLGALEQAEGNPAAARAALRVAIDSGHPQFAPIAACLLGALEERERDPAAARAAYQIAIDSGDTEVAALAAEMLATMSP
jgi:hypothetical protein